MDSPSQKVKCYYPLTRKHLVSMDLTFFKTIPFFSSSKKGAHDGKSFVPDEMLFPQVPLPVPPLNFDGGSPSRVKEGGFKWANCSWGGDVQVTLIYPIQSPHFFFMIMNKSKVLIGSIS